MKPYETAFLIAPNLSEEEMEKLIEKMAGIVSKKKGKMIKLDKWGKKKLAYPIKKLEEAFYVFFQYEGESSIPTELERNFKQTEAVIRYLTIRMEERENIRRKKKGRIPSDKAAEVRKAAPEKEEEVETIPEVEPEQIALEKEEKEEPGTEEEKTPEKESPEKKTPEEKTKEADLVGTEKKVDEDVVPEKAEDITSSEKAKEEKSEEKEKEE